MKCNKSTKLSTKDVPLGKVQPKGSMKKSSLSKMGDDARKGLDFKKPKV